MLDLKNKIIAILVVLLFVSAGTNIYTFITLQKAENLLSDCKFLSGYNYLNEAFGDSLHVDDLRNGNQYRFKSIKPIKPYMGETYLIRDDSGIKTISKYDVDKFTFIMSTK